jgi:hypothetical protein
MSVVDIRRAFRSYYSVARPPEIRWVLEFAGDHKAIVKR